MSRAIIFTLHRVLRVRRIRVVVCDKVKRTRIVYLDKYALGILAVSVEREAGVAAAIYISRICRPAVRCPVVEVRAYFLYRRVGAR